MFKTISLIILTVIISFSITGCFLSSTKTKKSIAVKKAAIEKAAVEEAAVEEAAIEEAAVNVNSCQQEDVSAPEWTCTPFVDGFYSGMGIVKKSKTGMVQTKINALTKSRRDLARQIKSQVKNKVENFITKTGLGDAQTITTVNINVSKKINLISLIDSREAETWVSPLGNLYMLVTLPQDNVNTIAKEAIIDSLKNDNTLWEQFQSGTYSTDLEIEFPTTSVKIDK